VLEARYVHKAVACIEGHQWFTFWDVIEANIASKTFFRALDCIKHYDITRCLCGMAAGSIRPGILTFAASSNGTGSVTRVTKARHAVFIHHDCW